MKKRSVPRASLLIVLVLAAVTGIVLAFYPQLDIKIASLFFDPTKKDFVLRFDPLLGNLRDISMWVVAALVVPAPATIVLKVLIPRTRWPMRSSAAVFLLLTFALGPGLLVNGLLKDQWPRSRPIDVAEFGGDERFVPWWDPRGNCRQNCSFVAGEGSAAFWTIAPAMLVPVPWRPVAIGSAIAFGSAVSLLRMAFGAHFMSDVLFAGIFIFMIVWVIHGLFFRWRRDKVLEIGLERIAFAGRAFVRDASIRVAAALLRGGRLIFRRNGAQICQAIRAQRGSNEACTPNYSPQSKTALRLPEQNF